MYNKSQLSKDQKAAREPKKLARPKDKFIIPGAPKVDPNGYWDPANVGRIIEVPLNEDSRSITMSYPDGTPLDQPLIGVGTDTGMMQYMMPGQDYIFPHDSSVIEHPIMSDGGSIMELTDEEIKKYRDAGYVVDLTPYPERHNPANSFPVTDPRSMQYGGTPKAQDGKEIREKYRKMNLIDLNLNPQQAAKKYNPVDPELFKAYMYYKNSGYQPSHGNGSCSSGKCYYDENAWKKFNDYGISKQHVDKPSIDKIKVPSSAPDNFVKSNNPAALKIEVQSVNENGDIQNTVENYDYPPIAMRTRGTQSIVPLDPTQSNRPTPPSSNIPTASANTLVKVYDKDQNKWVLNEVPSDSVSAKNYNSSVEYAKKNPQVRESSLFITPEEYVDYNNKKKRQADILSRFVTGMQNGGLAKAQNGESNVNLDWFTNQPSTLDLSKGTIVNNPKWPTLKDGVLTYDNATYSPEDYILENQEGYLPRVTMKKSNQTFVPLYSDDPKLYRETKEYNDRYGIAVQGYGKDKRNTAVIYNTDPTVIPSRYLPSSTKYKMINEESTEELEQQRKGGYVDNQMVHFQGGGNMDPGNNALELHMFYDKNNFEDGGSLEYQIGDEVDEATYQYLKSLGYEFE
jgi:hypothetical protein